MSEGADHPNSSLPDWIGQMFSQGTALLLVDPNGTVSESFGQTVSDLAPGRKIFEQSALFVGMDEEFSRLRAGGRQTLELEDITFPEAEPDRRHTVRCRWSEEFGAFFISVLPSSNPDSLSDRTLRESRRARYLEACIREERARFERIYRESPVLAVAFTPDGEVSAISRRLQDVLLGMPDEPLEGLQTKLSSALEPLRSQGFWSATWRGAYAAGAPLILKSADGDVLETEAHSFRVRATPAEREEAFFVLNDVTQRNALQGDLETRSRQLETANQSLAALNAELDRFATVAAHDLQEPLRKISSFSEMLEIGMAENDGEAVSFALDTMRSAVGRSRQLVEDILGLARMPAQAIRLETIDIAELLKGLQTDILDALQECNGRLSIETDVENVLTDRTLLQQSLENLIANGIKYRSDERELLLRLSCRADDCGSVVFSLADNGIGIPKGRFEQIFEPFVRLPNRDKIRGSGVGLSIVKRAIERLGGQVSVVSKSGTGSVFSITLPAPQD